VTYLNRPLLSRSLSTGSRLRATGTHISQTQRTKVRTTPPKRCHIKQLVQTSCSHAHAVNHGWGRDTSRTGAERVHPSTIERRPSSTPLRTQHTSTTHAHPLCECVLRAHPPEPWLNAVPGTHAKYGTNTPPARARSPAPLSAQSQSRRSSMGFGQELEKT